MADKLDPLDCAAKQREWNGMLNDMEDDRERSYDEDSDHDVEDSEDEEDAYERKEKIKDDVLDDMSRWLVKIRTAGLERTSELQKSCDCLRLCYDTIRDLELEPGRGFQTVDLVDESGTVLYSAGDLDYCALVCWVIKEVLVAAWATGDGDTKALVEATLVQDWFEEDTFAGELDCGDDIVDTADEVPLAQREVYALMKKLQETKALAEFRSKPTETVYKRILSDSPKLKEGLLTVAREVFLGDNKPKAIPWSDAFRILSSAEGTEDIERLLKSMPAAADEPSTETSRLEAVHSLLQSESRREQGVVYLRESLKLAAKDVMDDVSSAFPALDKACEAVKAHIDSYKLDRYRPHPKAKTITHRSADLDRYVKIAMEPSLFIPEATLSRATTSPGPGIGARFEGWIGELKALPEGEARTIRKEMLGNLSDHPLFKDTGDFAEVLIHRCRSSRPGTAESLRAVFKVFGPNPPPVAAPPRTRAGPSSQVAGQKRQRDQQSNTNGNNHSNRSRNNKKQKQRHNQK